MSVTIRSSAWGGSPSNTSDLLINYITDLIQPLEPQLRFAALGIRKDVPTGFDRLVFPQPQQIATTPSTMQGSSGGSVWGGGTSIFGSTFSAGSVGVTAITEGVNPSSIIWGANAYSASGYQYGVLVQVSDLLVRGSAIEVVENCSQQIQNAIARMVDDAIQVVVNAGSNGVIYAGGKTSRSTLASGDLLTQTEMTKAWRNLSSVNGAGLEAYDGAYYAAVIHPTVMADLMTNTGSGGWVDVGRYTNPVDLKEGKMRDFRGIRYLESAWVNYFNSSTNVFPTTVVGKNSYGWGYLQAPTPYIVSTPDSNNPLNVYTSISGKVTLGATRFEDSPGVYRIARCESATAS